ncbi:IclR family transcriptional regulator C-terminal domain-containing protein [Streptomyces sp. NPDC058247]|uniref:IclR family transcriptional regulator domain-containing protein n=1 Tax=Streptomyces sp. NPDC058247 TaxID=3346401 RepID=UPI0036E38E5F
MARLGRLADPHAGMVSRAKPLLQELADHVNESVTLSVPTPDDGIELVAEVYGSHVVGVMHRQKIGEHYPLHASSTRKAFLAELASQRLQVLLPEQLEAHTTATITQDPRPDDAQ